MFHLLWEIGKSKTRTEKALSTRTNTLIQPTSAIAGPTATAVAIEATETTIKLIS